METCFLSIKVFVSIGQTTTEISKIVDLYHTNIHVALICSIISLTNPVWVVKTRMCLQAPTSKGSGTGGHYSGVWNGLSVLYKKEGLRGCYRGFVPGMCIINSCRVFWSVVA